MKIVLVIVPGKKRQKSSSRPSGVNYAVYSADVIVPGVRAGEVEIRKYSLEFTFL